MPIITFSNQKGGVGKTTCAINIAAQLGIKGYRTLLCDLDPQGNATSGVSIDRRSAAASTYDLMIGRADAGSIIRETQFENLSVMPSSLSLAACEIELSSADNRHGRLLSALESVKDSFDFIIIDCPPSLGVLTINGLCAAQSVIIPMQCEFYALEGLSQLVYTIKQIKKLYNPKLDICGILITMYNARLNLSVQVMEELKKYYSDKLFSVAISRSVRLSEAPSYGMPIQYFDKSCKSTKLYQKLTDEILERINI